MRSLEELVYDGLLVLLIHFLIRLDNVSEWIKLLRLLLLSHVVKVIDNDLRLVTLLSERIQPFYYVRLLIVQVIHRLLLVRSHPQVLLINHREERLKKPILTSRVARFNSRLPIAGGV